MTVARDIDQLTEIHNGFGDDARCLTALIVVDGVAAREVVTKQHQHHLETRC